MSLESFFAKDHIKIEEKGQGFTIYADRFWTLEALINLMKNGLEASLEKGIEVESKENKIYQSILVRDFGPGIARGDMEKVYQRFYKANRNSSGFGLGLPMAKTIMEKQGGELLYYREKQGNCFEMRFYR